MESAVVILIQTFCVACVFIIPIHSSISVNVCLRQALTLCDRYILDARRKVVENARRAQQIH